MYVEQAYLQQVEVCLGLMSWSLCDGLPLMPGACFLALIRMSSLRLLETVLA